MGLRPRIGRKVTFYVYKDKDNKPIGDFINDIGLRKYNGEIIDIELVPNFMQTKMVLSWDVKRLDDGFVYRVYEKDDFGEYID